MSTASIMKTGSSRKPTRDLKISTINKYIETKVNKAGDEMTGNLNMSNNRIMNVKDLESDTDAVSMGFCQDYFSVLKDEIISKVERDQSEIRNSDVNHSNSVLDTINKKYLQIAYLNNSGTINTKKLMSICRFIDGLLAQHSDEFSTKSFYHPFRNKYTSDMGQLHFKCN